MGQSELVFKLNNLLGLFKELVTAQIGWYFLQIHRSNLLNSIQWCLEVRLSFTVQFSFLVLYLLNLVGKIIRLFIIDKLKCFSIVILIRCMNHFICSILRQLFLRVRLLSITEETLPFFLDKLFPLLELSKVFPLVYKSWLLVFIVLLLSQND